jgi:hypothetical protein
LINRINHHIYVIEYLKKYQYGFIPQTSTIDAIMAVKEFMQEGFSRGETTATISLNVEGAFNSAWWRRVLKNLQESGCPRNLFNLTKNYFSQRKATLATNNITIERTVSEGDPSRVLSKTWYVEQLLQLDIKFDVHERYKNSSFCRRSAITNKREVGERSGKYSEHRAKQSQCGQKKTKSVSTTKSQK